MSDNDQSVMQLCNALQAGDHEAARKLFELFIEPIRRVVRRKLSGKSRRVEDESDVAAAVLKSFFSGMAKGQYESLSDATELWKLVLDITSKKTIDAFRRSQRHAIELGESAVADSRSEAGGMDRFHAPERTPHQQAEMKERFNWLLDQLQRDDLRQVALLKLEGYKDMEIAVAIGRDIRTVERKMKSIRDTWKQCISKGTSEDHVG